MNRLARIFHVTPSYPPALGGMEKVVQILARAQAKVGRKVSVLTSNKRPKEEPQPDDGVKVKGLKTVVAASTRIMPGLLPRLLRIKREDVVHLHFASAYAPEMVWLASKIKGFSYVAHMHLDFVPTTRFGVLLKLYKPYVLKYVLRSASTVVVFTEDQKKTIHEQYGVARKNIQVIPNGVEDKFYYNTKRSLHKKTRLLFVGRLEAQKNLPQLLHALEGVSDKFETTIVGEGSLKNELQALAKDLKLKNVTFTGRADGEKLLNYYKQADLFILPSEVEGMPLVLLEAMAMGLPIIGTDVSGTRDVVTHNKNGLLVPFNDSKKMRVALTRIGGNNKLYQKLSTNARSAADDYSWTNVAERFESLYQKIAKKPQSQTRHSSEKVVALWKAALPLIILANLAFYAHNILSSIVTLFTFLLLPGYLLLNRVSHGVTSKWVTASLSVGLSILLLMVGGLLLNSLHTFGLSRPLDTFNIFAMLDVVALGLLYLNRLATVPVPQPTLRITKTKASVFGLLTLLPLLAIGGAIRLNNGASNILTMLMFTLIAGLFMVLIWRKKLDGLYPYALFMIALSVLFSTSLRGWFITGHDIAHEFEVFQATSQTGFWHTLTSHRDPYSACLSITILPTILAKITAVPDAYVFKAVFQIIFAFAVIPIYFLIQKLSNPRTALIGALLFIAFPPFLNDMPFLNRQEIALLFFSLLLLTTFIEMAYKPKFLLSCTFIIGLVLSHYSSSYVTLGILAFAWGFYQLITLKHKDSMPFALPILSLPFIIGAVALTFTWNALITQTSPGVVQTARKTIKTIETRSFTQANGVGYSLISFHTEDPTKILNDYAGGQASQIKYVPDANLPITDLGKVISHVISVETLNKFVRSSSAKILQVLLLIGAYMLFVKRRYSQRKSQKETYFLALVSACTALLILMVLIPQLSVEYSVTRLFQQALVIVALPIVLAAQLLASKAGRYKTHVVAGFFVFLFLHLAGFIPQLLGGYPPQMALNNAGTYYDIYYEHRGELLGAEWIDEQPGRPDVEADGYGKMRFPDYPFQREVVVSPVTAALGSSDFLYQNSTNTHKHTYASFLSGDVLEYTFNDQAAKRNTLYVNQASTIYSGLPKD